MALPEGTLRCSYLRYKFYNGGWSDWSSDLFGGYAGTSLCTVIKFRTQDMPEGGKSISFTFKIPFVRASSSAKSGTFYFRFFKEDPTTSGLATALPTASNHKASIDWESNDQEVHYATITIDRSDLVGGTYYYLAIGSSKTIHIGYDSTEGKTYTGTYDYYTEVSKGTVSIVDNGNNTFTVTGTLGASGINNPSFGPVVYWSYDANYGNKVTNGSKINLTIEDPSVGGRIVRAKSVTNATYGDNKPIITNKLISQYVAPSAPGIPTLSSSSYVNNKLLASNIWTYSWTAATRANSSSNIAGYRIRVYCNDVCITGVALEGDTIVGADNKNYWIDVNEKTLSIKLNPTSLGFKSGDTVKIGLYSFTKNKIDTKLFNGGGAGTAQVYSSSTKVDVEKNYNIKVKADGQWKDGLAYVKVDGNWRDVQAIYTKANGVWKLSK